MLLPKASMDQDSTWYRGRPRPMGQRVTWAPSSPRQQHSRRLGGSRCHLVRWVPARLLSEGAQIPSLLFRPRLLWPNGWMDQDATWYRGRPWPRRHCVRWTPSSPRKGHSSPPPPIFGACLLQPNGRPSQLLMTTSFSYSELFDESCQFQPIIQRIIWCLRCGSPRLSFAEILATGKLHFRAIV